MVKKKNKQPAKPREKGKLIELGDSLEKSDSLSHTNNSNKTYERKSSKDKDSSFDCLIPAETRELIKNINIDNFYLKLNKYAKFKDKVYEVNLKEQNIKKDFFNGDWENIYKQKIDSYYKNLKSLKNITFQELELKISNNSTLIIGSEESIYETSIKLHHIYGIPYIPSSAIKGVVRSYIIIEIFDSDEEKALEDKEFKKVFGSNDNQGGVIFFDAFPIREPKIKMDILNPHYSQYYNNKKAPTDTENPIPVNFLTVEKTSFKFILGYKDSSIKDKKIFEKTITIMQWLEEILKEKGIGAKTSVGYGYLQEEK